MTTVPSLPEPGPQSAQDRNDISIRYIIHAREELGKGHRLQAGEKAWGAMAQQLKIIGEARGWQHKSHQQLEAIGRQLVEEYESVKLSNALSDAYHKGHENFYENLTHDDEVEDLIEVVEEMLPYLASLHFARPQPVTIDSNGKLRRLKLLTGNSELQRGDTSPVGFSLRHQPDSSAGR